MGRCCVTPGGHCPAFLSEAPPPDPGSTQTISVGPASEADSADAVNALRGDTPVQVIAVQPAAEADGADAVAAELGGFPVQTIAINPASEADGAGVAQPNLAPLAGSTAVGVVSEADTAGPVQPVLAALHQFATVGPASEADQTGTVQPSLGTLPHLFVHVNPAAEADSAGVASGSVGRLGGIKLGVYAQNQQARFESAVTAQNGRVTVHRLYFQNQLASSMGLVSTRAAAGYFVYFSFKSAFTWEQVAAGNDDARWTGIGNMLAAIPNAGAWCFNHEPENDRLTYGSTANGNAFTAAFDHIAGIIKPLAPNWMASANLFDEVFPHYAVEFGGRGANWDASPDPEDWIPSSIDLLGVDYYSYRGVADGVGAPHWATNAHVGQHAAAVAEFLTYADAHGVPLCFPEFGYAIKDPAITPSDVSNQIAWLDDFCTTWKDDPRIHSIMYFEVNEQDFADRPNWAITDNDHPAMNTQVVQKFVCIGGGSAPPLAGRAVRKGAFTRDGLPSAGTAVHVGTVKLEWSTIEQTQGVRSRTVISNVLDQAQARGLAGVRLRIASGAFAPGWAKNFGNGPITYVEPQSSINTTVADIWNASYQNAMANFYAWLAAQFDDDPRLLAVFAGGASLYYAEPFIRGITNSTNRSNFLAAGYTQAKDKAVEKAQIDWMSGFVKTPVGLAYNPWQYITTGGGAASDLAFTEECMDYHMAKCAGRTILQNNSIRSSYVSSPPPLYDLFNARKTTVNTQYQVAGANQIAGGTGQSITTAFHNTMDWAISYLTATGVELVNGYQNYCTDADIAGWDADLIANGVRLP